MKSVFIHKLTAFPDAHGCTGAKISSACRSWPVLLLGLWAPMALAASSADPPVAAPRTNLLTLERVLREALDRNAGLKAARAGWQATRQRIAQARAWEDPRAGVDLERSGTRFDTYRNTEWMVSQEIPLSARPRLRGRVATAEAEEALLELRRREVDLAARVRRAWFRLANAHAQLDLTRRNMAVWRGFAESSRRRYELGTQSQADVLMAETELGRFQETLLDIEQQITDAQSELNVMMNRPADSPIARPAALSLEPVPGSLDELQDKALAQRPGLLILRQRVEAARARVTLARREWIPDPEVRVEARQFNGGGRVVNEYDTGIFLRIPWANRSKYRAAVDEAKNALAAVEHELEAMRVETLGLVRSQFRKIETLSHHYQLFSGQIVPLARQTVESRRIAYENAQTSLLELLTAQRAARETESMMQQHLADYLGALAELEAMIGASFGQPVTENQRTIP